MFKKSLNLVEISLILGVTSLSLLGISTFVLPLNGVLLMGVLALLAVSLCSFNPRIGLYGMAITFPFIEGQIYLTGIFSAPYVDVFALITLVGFGFNRLYRLIILKEDIQKQEFILFIPFLFFVIAYAFSLFNTSHVFTSLKYLLRPITFLYIAFVFLPFNLIKEKKHLIFVLWMMVFAGLMSMIFGLISLFHLDWTSFPRIKPMGILDFWPLGQNQNVLAQGLIVSMGCAIALAYLEASLKLRKLLMICVFFLSLTALGTFSRAAWLALLLQFLFVIFVYKEFVIKKMKQFLLGILIFFIPFLILMFQLITSDISVSANKNRILLTDISLQAFMQHPLIGNGAGTFFSLVESDRWYITWFGHGLDSHGIIQKILAEAGIIGFIAFIYLIFKLSQYVYLNYMRIHSSENKKAIYFLIMTVVSIFVFQLFNTSYFTSVLWLPVGILLAGSHIFSTQK